MTKPARAKLTLRNQPEAIPAETLSGSPAYYERNGTEIIFSEKAALIVHTGKPGDTELTIEGNVDMLMGAGAFAQLLPTGAFMKKDGVVNDDPETIYSLAIDPALTMQINAANSDRGVDFSDGFEEDTVFTQTPAQAAAIIADETPAIVAPTAAETPEGETVDFDLSGCDVTYGTTKTGSVYATIRSKGMRTTMAFGPVAEALRDQTKLYAVIQHGRSTDKMVAVRMPDTGDMVVELPKAA